MKKKKKKSSGHGGLGKKVFKFLEYYSQNTSFHGMVYIFSAATLFGRIIWFLIFSLAAGAFTYQMYDRISFYYQFTSNVNIEVADNTSLVFPVVTICNANLFRLSEAYRKGYLDNITKFYTANRRKRASLDYLDYLSFSDLNSLAHRKEDLIRECTWDGKECSAADFKEEVTEFGVCYSFNDRPDDALRVDGTGASHGLDLTLNAEVYESMVGPHLASGVRVNIRHQTEVSRVGDLGFDIPTYVYARVGVEMSQVKNLEPPYGKCGTRDLARMYRFYTKEACREVAYAKVALGNCGCLPHRLLRGNFSSAQQCNPSATLRCNVFLGQYDISTIADCPTTCEQTMFKSDSSETNISPQVVDRLVLNAMTDGDLASKYKNALEIRRKANRMFDKLDQQSVIGLKKDLDNLEAAVNRTTATFGRAGVGIVTAQSVLDGIVKTAEATTRNEVFRFSMDVNLPYIKNYLQPGLMEIVSGIRSTQFADISNLKKLLQQGKQKAVLDSLRSVCKRFTYSKSRIKNTRLTLAEISDHFLTWKNAKYQIMPPVLDSRRLNLKAILTNTSSFAQSVFQGLVLFEENCNTLKDLVKKPGEFQVALQDLKMLCRDNFKLASDLNARVEHALQSLMGVSDELQANVQNLKSAAEALGSIHEAVLDTMNRTLQFASGRGISNNIAVAINITNKAFGYVKAWETQNKSSLVDVFKLGREPVMYFPALMNILEKLAGDFEVSSSQMKDGHLRLMSAFKAGNFEKIDNISRPVDSRNADVAAMFEAIKELPKKYADFTNNFRNIYKDLQSFNQTLRIGPEFIRENYLRLSIFYRSLSYTAISQQKAYTWYALICDIGGTAGLFLGASFLTVLELLYHLGVTIMNDKKKAGANADENEMEDGTRSLNSSKV